MPTVVNDLILEPKAAPPSEGAAKPAGGGEKAQKPEAERHIEHVMHEKHERALRLCAY
jgi:hypothetical protein